MTTTPLSLHVEHSSFLWRLKLAIWCFEFSWKLSVFSTWSIWFVSFCLCLARWGCQRENPQKEVAADRPSNDNRAIQLGVVSIVESSPALSAPLVHCQCNVLSIVLFILSSYCIVFSIITSSYQFYHLMHSLLFLHRLVNCPLLLCNVLYIVSSILLSSSLSWKLSTPL